MSYYKNFIGSWKDENGKSLVIKNENGIFLTDFYINGSTTIERILLESKAFSKRMKSFIDGTCLVVELGYEGLGPTLRLHYSNDGKEGLISAVEMGLYDDYEDDFGVPWVFPLAIYYRI